MLTFSNQLPPRIFTEYDHNNRWPFFYHCHENLPATFDIYQVSYHKKAF